MSRLLVVFAVSCVLACLGCPPADSKSGSDKSGSAKSDSAKTDSAKSGSAKTGATVKLDIEFSTEGSVHDVICGCKLEEVGHCGEYIQIQEHWVPLTGALGLGDMPFCGKDGLKAQVAGEVKDGGFAFTEFSLEQTD
jgi:hypothetical protein